MPTYRFEFPVQLRALVEAEDEPKARVVAQNLLDALYVDRLELYDSTYRKQAHYRGVKREGLEMRMWPARGNEET